MVKRYVAPFFRLTHESMLISWSWIIFEVCSNADMCASPGEGAGGHQSRRTVPSARAARPHTRQPRQHRRAAGAPLLCMSSFRFVCFLLRIHFSSSSSSSSSSSYSSSKFNYNFLTLFQHFIPPCVRWAASRKWARTAPALPSPRSTCRLRACDLVGKANLVKQN